jgi:DNA-directed RNA polymerase alpha subunit
LEKGKIKNLGAIVKMTEDQLKNLEGMGDKGIKEIKKSIGDYGFNLKKD